MQLYGTMYGPGGEERTKIRHAGSVPDGDYRLAVPFRPPLISALGGLGLKPGRSMGVLPLTGLAATGFFGVGLPEMGFLGGGARGVALGGLPGPGTWGRNRSDPPGGP